MGHAQGLLPMNRGSADLEGQAAAAIVAMCASQALHRDRRARAVRDPAQGKMSVSQLPRAYAALERFNHSRSMLRSTRLSPAGWPCATRSALDLPFAARCPAPGELVVTGRWPPGDDVMAHHVARHAARAEYPYYGGSSGAFHLRVAPRVGLSDLTRLNCIEPRHAIEHPFGCLAAKGLDQNLPGME
jgi:hypothetical protein